MAAAIISQEELKSLLHYDPETGIFTRLVTTSHNAKAGDVAGGIQKTGYIAISVKNNPYYAHRLAWLYMTGEFPSCHIDHKDMNKVNNKWENLRTATKAENSRNTNLLPTNSSGYRGVYWLKSRNRWIANVEFNGKKLRLGTFKDKEQAAKAYIDFAKKHYNGFDRF